MSRHAELCTTNHKVQAGARVSSATSRVASNQPQQKQQASQEAIGSAYWRAARIPLSGIAFTHAADPQLLCTPGMPGAHCCFCSATGAKADKAASSASSAWAGLCAVRVPAAQVKAQLLRACQACAGLLRRLIMNESALVQFLRC
jgi:hypothetical protein